tara:strand:+ start:702 stop:2417 length:1716 start_codon:yes stop_codon:yes gene_type:complete
MKNILSEDPSPYLQQHKNNPVHWQTWNKESLNQAKTQKKPILLSIGYSSCHWCHVMAHESFEDQSTADLMNKFFINIKVDREERPDLDFVFQSSFQLFNQSGGGWPLTMFLDENGVPFMGGTYFPKNEKHGLPAFKTILQKVHDAYADQRIKIIEQKNLIIKNLELKKTNVIGQEPEPILENILNNLDNKNGGYKGAPKFPTFYVFETLIYFYNKTKNSKYLKPVELVLEKLCSRGIYDHVEGGISRYTIDENWLIPHFEKMLYDNVQFILLLAKLLKIKHNKYYLKKIKQTTNFLNTNFLTKETSLLGSAFDADSEGIEGKYYVYNYDELKNIKDIEVFFNVKPEGNWEGKIILDEIKEPNDEIIKKLLEIRAKRKKPFFDKKNQLDLNCLWVSSLISLNSIIPNEGYLKTAENFYDKIEKKFCIKNIYHSHSKDISFIEDYAYLIQCLLDLSDSTMNIKYKLLAKKYCDESIIKFYDNNNKLFQKNEKSKNDIFMNPIDISDNTLPNANSIMLINFSRLGFVDQAKELSNSLNGYLNVYKNFMISSLKALDFFKENSSGKNCNTEGCEI